MNNKKLFQIDWILINELAIGKIPKKEFHLLEIKKKGIKSIFSLCGEDEAQTLEKMYDLFNCERFVLPDHKSGRILNVESLLSALKILDNLLKSGPVYIHCIAAMERSPIVCMGWLIKKHKLSLDESLNYLMDIHLGTNPLTEQINILKDEKFLNERI